MQISIIDDTGSTARIALTGKLDIAGADIIALPLAALAGSKSGIVIDMSAVTFIASLGIRQLVSASKVLMRRGGRLVLVNPTAPVADVLITSGANEIMDIARADTPSQS